VNPGQIVGSAALLARAPQWDPRLLWYALALVVLLLVGAYVIWLADRWRKRAQQPHVSSGDQLAHFRRLYEQGEISAEEFARIRGLLTDRMVKEMEKPPPPEAPPQAPPPLAPPDLDS
jgi:hypothetical protein